MAYSENVIYKIKKGGIEYDIKDAIAAAAITVLNSDASTNGSVAKAKAEAISAASSDATTKANAAEAAAKLYADGLASNYDAAGAASAAIAALDATPSQTAGTDGLALSLTQIDGVVTAISGSIAANTYDAHGAASTAKSEVIGANTDAASANTIYGAKADATAKVNTAKTELIGTGSDLGSADTINGAKNYAKGLIDKVLGEDAASTTLATLKQVIQELNAPENQNGITGTFIDTVKADLAGLTKDDGHGGTTSATVKEYVDNVKAAVEAQITASNQSTTTAIEALDATPSQSAGADGLALSLTQVDGVVTSISGSIAAKTYDAYGAASTAKSQVIGTSGDASSANTIYGAKAYADAAKSAVIGSNGDAKTANTIYGAKAYADDLITSSASSIANGVLTLGL